jgi:ribosomal protein L11 methyltransferase
MHHDILVANILSNTLIELGPELRERVRDGGHIALSGILYDQADAVRAAWSDWAQLDIGDRTDNWVLLTGRKHGKAEA